MPVDWKFLRTHPTLWEPSEVKVGWTTSSYSNLLRHSCAFDSFWPQSASRFAENELGVLQRNRLSGFGSPVVAGSKPQHRHLENPVQVSLNAVLDSCFVPTTQGDHRLAWGHLVVLDDFVADESRKELLELTTASGDRARVPESCSLTC